MATYIPRSEKPQLCEKCGKEEPICAIREAPDFIPVWIGRHCFEDYLARKVPPARGYLGEMTGGKAHGRYH